MIKKILLFSLLLCGCGINYGEDYTIHISPKFGSKTEYITDSLSEWKEAVGLSYAVTIEEADCKDPGNICMYVATEAFLKEKHPEDDVIQIDGLTLRNILDFSDIYILDTLLINASDNMDEVSFSNYELKQTILHELGHAFGLSHDPHSGAVMCKNVQCAAAQITCWDKKQYFNLRDTEYYCDK